MRSEFISAYLAWIGELASLLTERGAHPIADRLNEDTDHWLRTAMKVCAVAVASPSMTIGVFSIWPIVPLRLADPVETLFPSLVNHVLAQDCVARMRFTTS